MDNLKFWLRLRGIKFTDQTLIDELKIWNLDHPLIRKNFPVEKFSTGMKRRFPWPGSSIQTPVWLLDEPLYGLDVKGIAQFQDIIKHHLENNGSAVIVSHDVAPLQAFNPIVYKLEKVGGQS